MEDSRDNRDNWKEKMEESLEIWKIEIKGNSMEGLFSDGEQREVLVNKQTSQIEVGNIIILKKKKTFRYSQNC